MFTRIITVSLVALLVIPAVTLTHPDHTGPSPWGGVAVAAKGMSHHGHKSKDRDKHNKHKKHEQPAGPAVPANSTVRQSVTRTFTSTEPIAIPNGGSNNANEGAG